MTRVMSVVLAAGCLAGLGMDPNRLPQDETQRYARVCVEQAGRPGDAQIEVAPDVERACATRGEGGGAMVVPAGKLTEKLLQGAGKSVLPVGQLWLRKWTLVAGGKAVPAERLRMVTVNVDDKDRPMPLCLLGVRRPDPKKLELVIYAREAEPLLVLPLESLDTRRELPLELEWMRGEKGPDTLTLSVLGKYQAVLPIDRLAQ